MTRLPSTKDRRFPWIAYLVLIASLVATVATWLAQGQRERAQELADFRYETDLLADSIQQRIQQYVDVLRAAQSLVSTYPNISAATFEAYVQSVDLPVHYPGFKTIQLVRGEEAVNELRLTAIDADRLDFAMTLPVYRNGTEPGVAAERRAPQIGKIRGVLAVDGALGNVMTEPSRAMLRMRLSDTGQVGESRSTDRAGDDRLLVDVGNPDAVRSRIKPSYRYAHSVGFTVGGRVWVLEFEQRRDDPLWHIGPLLVLASGAVIAALLFGLIVNLYRSRDRAILRADRAGAKLSASEAHYRSVVDNVRDVVFQIDHNNRWKFLSPAWHDLTGQDPAEAVGRDALAWINPADLSTMRQALSQLGSGLTEVLHTRIRYHVPKRGDRWLQWHARSVSETANGPWVVTGTLVDVTESVLAQQTVEHRVHHDTLTGLPNRALLLDRAASALEHAERAGDEMALVFVDLDGFKQINDQMGHQGGDTVLRSIAKRLQQAVRRSDLVARLGGDEFVVLIANGANKTATERVLEQIRSIFVAAVRVDNQRVTVNASLGVAVFPHDGTTVDALLRKADHAMYANKSGYDPALNAA